MVSVGGSPEALFGFDVSVLIGKPVGAFVDVFLHAAPPGEGAALSPMMMMKAGGSMKRSGSLSQRGSGFNQGSKSGDEEIELPELVRAGLSELCCRIAPLMRGHSHLHSRLRLSHSCPNAFPQSGPPLDVASALVRLAERSVLDAGTSWRVGVLDPIPMKSCLKGLGVITDAVWSQKTTPAAMTLRIKESLISRPKPKVQMICCPTALLATISPARSQIAPLFSPLTLFTAQGGPHS